MRGKLFGLLAGLIGAGSVQAGVSGDGELANWGLFASGKSLVPFDLGGDQVDQAAASVVGADGSLYIAGTVKDAGGVKHFGLAKLKPDGTLDTGGFGGGDGLVLSPNTAGTLVATGLALRGSALYVGGYREVSGQNRDFALCVFSTSGVPLLFLHTGTSCVTASFDLGTTISQDMARAIAVQPDGKIVLAGTTAVSSTTDTYAAFARYNTDGTLDTSFGLSSSGQQLLRSANYLRHRIASVAIASNGKIVAGGSTDVVGGSDTSGLLIRLNANGSLDTLAPGGEYAFEVDGSNSRDTVVNDLVLVDDPANAEDDVVVAGYAEMTANKHSGLIARIKHANALDTGGFSAGDGSNGFDVVTGGDSVEFASVARQPGVGYVVGGTYFPSGAPSDFYLGRYLDDGHLDTLHPSVPANQVVLDFGLSGQFDTLADVQVQGSGIYAVGTGFKTMTNADFVAAKLDLDRIFGSRFE